MFYTVQYSISQPN